MSNDIVVRAFKTLEERFLAKVLLHKSGCWEWIGAKTGNGYGAIQESNSRKLLSAHRYSFFRDNGYYPKEVDHTCFNKWCVNPEHLEDVTHDENMKRADKHYGLRSQKLACPRGHEYNSDNTYYNSKSNRRTCRKCMKEVYQPKYKAKKRGLVYA